MIEILKALSQAPRILILDEPTASLGSAETERLFEALGRFRAAGGSVIYVSHRLAEVLRIADRVSVLRDGRHVATRLKTTVNEEELARLMVGRPLANIYGARFSSIGPEVLRLEGSCRGRRVRRHQFVDPRRGDFGPSRSGRGGANRTGPGHLRGRAADGGSDVPARSTRSYSQPPGSHSERHRLCDRRPQGTGPVPENDAARELRQPQPGSGHGKSGTAAQGAVSSLAEMYRQRFRIVTPSIRQQVRNLSGGNQQKVLLAMWMGIDPVLLIIDKPTRGVDIGARSEIYQLLRESAARGVALLMISSDLPELLGMCDRIAVMRDGRITGCLAREEATEENIIALATGWKA